MGHFLQAVFGFTGGDGNSPEYLFWSGAGSDLAYLTFVWGGIVLYRKHNCHLKHCMRIGRHEYRDQDTGVKWLLCWKHHPEVPQRQLIKPPGRQ